MNVYLAEKLKSLRAEKRVSQEKLAQYLNVSFQAVSKWENAWTEHQRCESTLEFEIQARGKTAMATLEKVMAYFDSEVRDLDLWPYVGSGGHDDIQNAALYHEGKILEVAIVKLYIHTTLPKENASEFFDILDINVKRSDTIHVATITVPPRNETEGE